MMEFKHCWISQLSNVENAILLEAMANFCSRLDNMFFLSDNEKEIGKSIFNELLEARKNGL